MIQRRTTGIVLGAVLIVLGLVQGWPLRLLLVACMALSMFEMYGAFAHRGSHPARWVGALYTAAVLPAYWLWGSAAFMPLATLSMMLGMSAVLSRGQGDFDSLVATVFPLIYPGMMFPMLLAVQDMGGRAMALLALLLVFLVSLMGDVMAYEVGTLWGRRKLCPAISPKKTVEGALAGVVTSTLRALLALAVVTLVTTYIPALQPYREAFPPAWQLAIVGLIGGVASQFGDLTASLVKRYCGVKDYGSILPGHGGLMDRIDGVLFNAAVVYIYFSMVVIR